MTAAAIAPATVHVRPQQSPFVAPATGPVELAIIVPTMNERENIVPLIERIGHALPHVHWEIIFVDDDSQDATADFVRSIGVENPRVRVLQRIGRYGLSSACIEGMLATSAPYLAVMDADLQHDEAVLGRMLELIESDSLDIVIGTRNGQGGSKGEFAKSRVMLSDAGAKISALVCKTPVTDPMSGFFMVSRDCLFEVVHDLTGIGFKIMVDILASSRRKLRIAEVPYTFRRRNFGKSKLDINTTLDYLYLLIDKVTKGYIPPRFAMFALVGGTGAIVHFITLAILFISLRTNFIAAQAAATMAAMTWNFLLNNATTFRRERYRGIQIFKGLFLYYIACSLGAFTSTAVARFTYSNAWHWLGAAGIGVIVASIWNYVINSLFTWRGSRRRSVVAQSS